MKKLKHLPNACGLDEAGRGPLAGPVAAAAVILPKKFNLAGINDSKQLDRQTREDLEKRIKTHALWSVVLVHHEEVDSLNIFWASMAAMERAYAALGIHDGPVLVDGNRVPNKLTGRGEAVIKGDATWACIAAASILAKTARDRYMVEISDSYPGYGFEKHFGYPTPEHFMALHELGPCPIHRRSFAPVAAREQGVLIFE
ncbi:MAG TPA: ribonuclease HII [Fimbriimonadaceae bacterium]|nr:ribonuclease HII [Fimbriimonadaceae bacterium]